MRRKLLNKFDDIVYFFKINIFILFNRKEYNLLNKNVFIAYTMGKVGSITVEKAISKRVFYNKVFHVHFLSEEGLKKHKEFNKTDSGYKLAARFEEELKNNKDKRLKVITLVREPISRDISDLFENYYRYIPEQKESGILVDKMLDHFKTFDHPYGLEWLDEELKQYLGIDLYAYDFNKKSGYQILHRDNFDILVMRLEDLTRVFDKAMFEFTGIKGWKLAADENTAKDKFYSDSYKEFKKKVVIDKTVLEMIYNSKYFNHFYSEEEKVKFMSKWKSSDSQKTIS